jgi:hypothetical protein
VLREMTLSFFIINAIILGALTLSYCFAAYRMKSKIIYSLAALFIILTLTEIFGIISFISISYLMCAIVKAFSIIAAGTFLVYSFKKQKVLKNELHE